MRIFRTLFIIPWLIVGCASSISAPKSNSSPAVDVITVQDQALLDIQSAPTDFTVDFSDSQYAWQRARMFFNQYTTGAAVSDSKLSNVKSEHDLYFYEVRRALVNGGYRYSVQSVPRSKSASSNMLAFQNAKNLARFIKEGTLEVSLLAK